MRQETALTLVFLQFLFVDQTKAIIIHKPTVDVDFKNFEHHQTNVIVDNPIALKSTPENILILTPSDTKHDHQTELLPQASSSMYKTTVHSNLKHIITKDNLKFSVIMKTTEHSQANIVHPFAFENSHARTQKINTKENLVANDLISKKNYVLEINENTKNNNLGMDHDMSGLSQSSIIIKNNKEIFGSHIKLQKPVIIANNVLNLIKINTMEKHPPNNHVLNSIGILNNDKEINRDIGKLIVVDVNPMQIKKSSKFDTKMESLKIKSISKTSHNDGSEDDEMGNYSENLFRNPVGGFGTGLNYGGHGAGHGYFGYYG